MRRAGEDYLGALLSLERKAGGKGVRITDLASALGVSKPSANRAVNHLREEGCVEQESYGSVYLSRRGRAVAEDIEFRHQTLLRFFTDVLEVSPDTAENDANLVEHDISPEALEKLLSYMQGEKGKGSCGPGLVDMVESSITGYLEGEKSEGRIRGYECSFNARYSPYSFTYTRPDGETVYCIVKYESFDRTHLEMKCKMLNFILTDPDRLTELWYVSRSGNGRKISVSRTIREYVSKLIPVMRDANGTLNGSGAAVSCFKLTADVSSLGLEDVIEF